MKSLNKISLIYLVIVLLVIVAAWLETKGVTGNQRELLLEYRGQRIESLLLFFACSGAFGYLFFTYNLNGIYNYFFLNFSIYLILVGMNSLFDVVPSSSVYAFIVRLSYYFKYISTITLIACTFQLEKDRKQFLEKQQNLQQKIKSLEHVE